MFPFVKLKVIIDWIQSCAYHLNFRVLPAVLTYLFGRWREQGISVYPAACLRFSWNLHGLGAEAKGIPTRSCLATQNWALTSNKSSALHCCSCPCHSLTEGGPEGTGAPSKANLLYTENSHCKHPLLALMTLQWVWGQLANLEFK